MRYKYYCSQCHEICDNIERVVTIHTSQPVSTNGTHIGCEHEFDRNTSGARCLLCKSVLPMTPANYIVTIISDDDGVEYISSIDIYNIYKQERERIA